jgi:hypothetical protein
MKKTVESFASLFQSSPSSFRASLFITISRFRHYGLPIGLVYSIYDATEVAIQRTIEAAQRMIRVNNNNNSQEKEEQPEIIRINSAMKRHLELEIETLQNAPRDEGKLRELLKLKEK